MYYTECHICCIRYSSSSSRFVLLVLLLPRLLIYSFQCFWCRAAKKAAEARGDQPPPPVPQKPARGDQPPPPVPQNPEKKEEPVASQPHDEPNAARVEAIELALQDLENESHRMSEIDDMGVANWRYVFGQLDREDRELFAKTNCDAARANQVKPSLSLSLSVSVCLSLPSISGLVFPFFSESI